MSIVHTMVQFSTFIRENDYIPVREFIFRARGSYPQNQ